MKRALLCLTEYFLGAQLFSWIMIWILNGRDGEPLKGRETRYMAASGMSRVDRGVRKGLFGWRGDLAHT